MFADLSVKRVVAMCIVALAMLVVLAGTFYALRERLSIIHAKTAWAYFTYTMRYALSGSQGAAAGQVLKIQAAVAQNQAEAIPVLLYHGEGANSDMSLTTFVDQLRSLKAAGWQTITLAQFEDFMKGRAALPAKSFLLTFDDGRTDTFYASDPVLKELGYSAVMFVITGLSMPDNRDDGVNQYYLDKAELAYMQDTGRWDLQSHGNADHQAYLVPDTAGASMRFVPDGHYLSDKFWLPEEKRMETDAEYTARITNDLTVAKQVLETDFKKPVTAYAYPFGDFGEASVNFSGAQSIVAQVVPSIYAFSFYQVNPADNDFYNYPDSAQSMIKRIEPDPSWSGQDLVALMERRMPKFIPYVSPLGADWRGNWGTLHAQSGALVLAATATSSGASAFIDGTAVWRDYAILATGRVTGGSEITLVARYRDNDDKIYCTFQKESVQLVEYAGGIRTILSTTPRDVQDLSHDSDFSMSVVGSNAACIENGAIVAAATHLDSRLSEGEVGLQTWDQQLGASVITVGRFEVTPAAADLPQRIESFLNTKKS